MASIFDLFKSIEKKADTAPITHIVAGLGNIGAKYEKTRHNAGFIALDHIAAELGVKVDKLKFRAMIGECTIAGKRALLMKPTTLMNNSGLAIAEAASFYKIPPENIIVIHDEISFDPGVIRIRRKGSAGGHNGLKSIIASLGSEDFPRIKVGVGKKPTPEYDLVDWVLGVFPKEARESIDERLPDIMAAVELMVSGRIDDAMCKYSK